VASGKIDNLTSHRGDVLHRSALSPDCRTLLITSNAKYSVKRSSAGHRFEEAQLVLDTPYSETDRDRTMRSILATLDQPR
jgi:hypothetical protein